MPSCFNYISLAKFLVVFLVCALGIGNWECGYGDVGSCLIIKINSVLYVVIELRWP